jgi:hypothetical protein
MNKWIFIFASSFFYSQYIFAQCNGNLFKNGSFTHTTGEDVHTEGWRVGSTPDVNTHNDTLRTTSGYVWIGKPLPSFNGGTWQNLYSQREYLEQTVNVKPGEWYTIRFEYAAQGIEVPGSTIFKDPVGIYIYIDGELVYSSPEDRTQYTWEKGCYLFIAKSSSITIRSSASIEQYVGLDGVCLQPGKGCGRPAPF